MSHEIDSVERDVCLWLAYILAASRVGPDDDFFGLGGDSLAATMLSSAIETRFGVIVDPVEIFERPRIGDFAFWLERQLALEPPASDEGRS